MNGVNKSDQLLAKYNLMRECIRWWKTLFFHMVDMAVVNGLILFQAHQARNKTIDSLKRQNSYSLLGLPEYANPPVFKSFKQPIDEKYQTDHIPVYTAEK